MESTNNSNYPDIELLGQKIYLPRNGVSLTAFIFILLSIVAIIFIGAKYGAEVTKTVDGIKVQFANVKEGNVSSNEGYIIGIWTPSMDTYGKDETPDEDHMWEKVYHDPNKHKTIASANEEFGTVLKGVFSRVGYRRFKVSGEGYYSDNIKNGWWWEIGIEGPLDEKDLVKLKESYIKFWNPGANWKNFYVEVIGKSDSN